MFYTTFVEMIEENFADFKDLYAEFSREIGFGGL